MNGEKRVRTPNKQRTIMSDRWELSANAKKLNHEESRLRRRSCRGGGCATAVGKKDPAVASSRKEKEKGLSSCSKQHHQEGEDDAETEEDKKRSTSRQLMRRTEEELEEEEKQEEKKDSSSGGLHQNTKGGGGAGVVVVNNPIVGLLDSVEKEDVLHCMLGSQVLSFLREHPNKETTRKDKRIGIFSIKNFPYGLFLFLVDNNIKQKDHRGKGYFRLNGSLDTKEKMQEKIGASNCFKVFKTRSEARVLPPVKVSFLTRSRRLYVSFFYFVYNPKGGPAAWMYNIYPRNQKKPQDDEAMFLAERKAAEKVEEEVRMREREERKEEREREEREEENRTAMLATMMATTQSSSSQQECCDNSSSTGMVGAVEGWGIIMGDHGGMRDSIIRISKDFD